jgi:6-phosphogluconolactonase
MPENAIRFVADLFQTIVCDAVGRSGNAFIALSGGSTPRAVYQLLAERTMSDDTLPWGKVEVFFSDERDVSQDSIESNYRTAQRLLLDHLPITPGQIHPMPADAGDMERSAAEHDQAIRQLVPAGAGGIPSFDLIMLGMGLDGHVGSLFPCTPEALEEKEKLVLSHFVPVLGRKRMTFTFPLINAAKNVVLFITGADKSNIVASLLDPANQQRSRIPASHLAPVDGQLFIVLDAAAASQTSLRPN